MIDRLGGLVFVFYFLLVVGLPVAIINVAARIAGSAFQGLTIERSATPKTSRVTTGLEAQQRADGWQSPNIVPDKPTATNMPVGELAKKLDAAENHALPDYANLNDLQSGPAVAGWVKRVQDKPAVGVEDETPSGIVLRSLGRER